jgi:hypothetical protein
MIDWAIYDTASGAVLMYSKGPTAPTPPTGAAVLQLAAPPNLGATSVVTNGALTAAVPTLADNQAAQVTAAQALYDGLIAAGFTWQGVLYQIDSTSQSQMAAMAIAALGTITDPTNNPAWPSGFTWIAANNTQTAMTAAQMYAFARAVAGYVSACILNLRAIKTAILATTTQAALTAIDVTAGYPAASA